MTTQVYRSPSNFTHPLRKSAGAVQFHNPRIEALKELMELEKNRIESQNRLTEISLRVESIQRALLQTSKFEARPTNTQNRNSKSHSKAANDSNAAGAPSAATSHLPRMQRGELLQKVVTALESAGNKGISVKSLAETLAIKPANLHSWFHSAIKRYSEIPNTAPGHYTLNSQNNIVTRNSRLSQRKYAVRGSRRHIRPARGEVTKRILRLLEQAGPEGISVTSIAANLGAHYRNVHVWFSSTGKKFPLIEKVGRALYRLNPTGTPAVTQIAS